MAITNGTYVNPGWKNGGPPALNAVELNAISDALAEAQAKNTSQDSLIAALQTAVGGSGKIAVGSYGGTGTYGESNPQTLTLPFSPLLVYIFLVNSKPYVSLVNTLVFQPNYFFSTYFRSQYYYLVIQTLQKTGNTITWYPINAGTDSTALNATDQQNVKNQTYLWFAFG